MSESTSPGTARPSDRLHVEVVSKHGPLWSGSAQYVSIPAVDGRLGILSGRQPVLAVLNPGVVEIQRSGSPAVAVSVDGGFASVDRDYVTVVVEGGAVAS